MHVDGDLVSEIGHGVLVLLGVHHDDTDAQATYIAEKVANLRIFPDAAGQMNESALDQSAEALVVSQFTLYADTSKGRRPSFVDAARPEVAEPLVEAVAAKLTALGVSTGTGVFGAHMDVELVNDGPVTLLIDDGRRPKGDGQRDQIDTVS